MRKNGIQTAQQLFADGRIQNPDDWEEMKLELTFELQECGWAEQDIARAVETVKLTWYSKEKTS